MIRRPPISTRTVFPDTTLFRSESIYRDDFPTSRAERSEEYSMKMNDMMIISVDDHISEPPGMFDKHLSGDDLATAPKFRSDEHPSELQSLMRISYAAVCLLQNTQPQYLTTVPHSHYTHHR